MNKYLFLSLLIFVLPGVATANQFEIGGTNYQMNGGVAINLQYLLRSASQIGEVGTAVNDLVLELKPVSTKNNSFVFHAAVGQLQQQDIFHTTAPIAPLELGVFYGWLEAKLSDSVSFEAGQIQDQLSYESPISFKKNNILMGAIQRSQATYYPGFRFSLYEKTINILIFAEYGGPDNFTREQVTVGLRKKTDFFELNAGFANGVEAHDTVAVSVKTNIVKYFPFGFSYTHKIIDDVAPQFDQPANAVGIYVKPNYQSYSLPIRIEYINDGDTNIYKFGKGYTLTLSPTKQLSKNTFVRCEFIYAKADGKPFKTESAFVEKQVGLAFQLSWVF